MNPRIEELLAEARNYKELSDKYRRMANERRDQIRVRVLAEHESRAKKGNSASQGIIKSDRLVDLLTNKACSEDNTWLGYVDDQQFNERLANQAAQQLMAEATVAQLEQMTR